MGEIEPFFELFCFFIFIRVDTEIIMDGWALKGFEV